MGLGVGRAARGEGKGRHRRRRHAGSQLPVDACELPGTVRASEGSVSHFSHRKPALARKGRQRERLTSLTAALQRFHTSRFNVTLLDAPGHRDFVPNAIAGAAQVGSRASPTLLPLLPAVLLNFSRLITRAHCLLRPHRQMLRSSWSTGPLVALKQVLTPSLGRMDAVRCQCPASLLPHLPSGFDGSGSHEHDHGQPREHAQLARSLGIEQLAVVVSKLDMCSEAAGERRRRFEEVREALLPFLKTCGFKAGVAIIVVVNRRGCRTHICPIPLMQESALQWLPAIGPSGQNVASPPTDPVLASWWKGPTVLSAVDAFTPRERAVGESVRGGLERERSLCVV